MHLPTEAHIELATNFAEVVRSFEFEAGEITALDMLAVAGLALTPDFDGEVSPAYFALLTQQSA